MDYKRIGEKIQKNRTNKNKSQEEFAEEIGISPSYLGQIERGQRKAALKTLEKISKHLDMPIENLICEMNINDELYQFLESETKAFLPDDKEELVNFMKLFLKMMNHMIRRKYH